MRFSRIFIPTLKEPPSDAEVVSQRLMTRAGMIRKVASGIYNLLPLGVRVISKVEKIVREEMTRAGALEVRMPFVLPAELWKESGRWEQYGAELLRLRDRHGREFCLGPTHEEAVTAMVSGEVRSYRQLPLNLFQIQAKFRDEIRPRFGLMRAREFVMKDAYSFHADEECAEREYMNMYETYRRIFERCGLEFRAVEAETGAIGGKFSHEFMVIASTGEDAIASCDLCDYAANVERAEVRPPELPPEEAEKRKPVKEVSTPGKKTVAEVSELLGVEPRMLIKTLLYETERGVVAALVRGDDELNENKLLRNIGASWVKLADDEIVREATGAPAGFAGPVGLGVPIYADYAVRYMCCAVTGANKADRHLVNVQPERDFHATYADLRVVRDGDGCPRCDGELRISRGIEVGHIFKLGTKYSEAMGAAFLDEKGKEKPFIMGCYGIGIGRTAAAAIEQNHDEAGIIWPHPLSPFDCEILPLNVNDEEVMKTATGIYESLGKKGLDVLIDDRDERAGVKFKDADLIGISIRITVGSKNLKEGLVEVKERASASASLVTPEEAAALVEEIWKKARL